MRIGKNPAKGTQIEVDDAYHRIIIPVYIPKLEGFFKESLSVLKLCLTSLYTTVHSKTKISVASNGSCKEVNDFLGKELEALRIDELYIIKTSIGKINSIFKVMNTVKESIVTVSDADVLFSSGWQNEVEQVYLDYPKVGMVCPFSYSKGFRELTANIYFDNFFNKKIKIDKITNPAALEHFAKSIDNENFYSEIHKKYGIIYQEKGKSKVLIGAGHFVATFKRDVFEPYSFQPQLRKLANGERQFLDTPPVACGLWRVSTLNNFVYHMGNTIMPMYHEVINNNSKDTFKDFPLEFRIQRQSAFLFKLKNKYFARYVYSNRVFVYLLKKYGFSKEEAILFIK